MAASAWPLRSPWPAIIIIIRTAICIASCSKYRGSVRPGNYIYMAMAVSLSGYSTMRTRLYRHSRIRSVDKCCTRVHKFMYPAPRLRDVVL